MTGERLSHHHTRWIDLDIARPRCVCQMKRMPFPCRCGAVRLAFVFALAHAISPLRARAATPEEAALAASNAREEPRLVSLALGSGVQLVPRFDGTPFAYADVQATVPIAIEVGYFVAERLEVGAFGQLGAILTAHDPNTNEHQNGRELRLGGFGRYHFAPHRRLDPWAGLSLGYESFTIDRGDVTGGAFSALAQGGLGVSLGKGVAFGPFVSFGTAMGPWTWTAHLRLGDVQNHTAFYALDVAAGVRAAVFF